MYLVEWKCEKVYSRPVVLYTVKIVETVFQSTSRFVIKCFLFSFQVFIYFFLFLFFFLSWITENFLYFCTLPMLCLHKRLIIKQTRGIVTRILKVSHENPEMWLKNANALVNGLFIGECRGNRVTCSYIHDNYFEILSSHQPFGR